MTQFARLCEKTLDDLPADVERPGYDRSALTAGVAHIGPGAFHRAHQAVAFDDLARGGDLRWGITGISLRSAAARQALAPQDGLYALVIPAAERTARRIVGAVRRVVTLENGPWPAVEALADRNVRIVTLTLTEAGYGPPVRHGPATAAGLLSVALALRRQRGLPGLTVLSCDNLVENGRRVAGVVRETAAAFDPELAEWIDTNVAFPSTMVDRITPSITQEDIDAFAAYAGVVDQALVQTEAFSQWVVEDRFIGGRPDLETVGVRMVADVAPFEKAKLRVLNGAHSAMAWLGLLGGVEFVHEFIADAVRRGFILRLWDEVAETLVDAPGIDLDAYRMELLARFEDPAIGHRLAQIAVDSPQKLSQRLIPPLAERCARGLPSPALTLAVAAWIKGQSGRSDSGEPIDLADPAGQGARQRVGGSAAPAERVAAMISMPSVFPPDLAANPELREALTRALHDLDVRGSPACLATLAAEAA